MGICSAVSGFDNAVAIDSAASLSISADIEDVGFGIENIRNPFEMWRPWKATIPGGSSATVTILDGINPLPSSHIGFYGIKPSSIGPVDPSEIDVRVIGYSNAALTNIVIDTGFIPLLIFGDGAVGPGARAKIDLWGISPSNPGELGNPATPVPPTGYEFIFRNNTVLSKELEVSYIDISDAQSIEKQGLSQTTTYLSTDGRSSSLSITGKRRSRTRARFDSYSVSWKGITDAIALSVFDQWGQSFSTDRPVVYFRNELGTLPGVGPYYRSKYSDPSGLFVLNEELQIERKPTSESVYNITANILRWAL